jgi:hypothetical protein
MSALNFWPIERYKPDAFNDFKSTIAPNFDFDPGTARALMWAAQLAYELDTFTSEDKIKTVKTILKLWNMELVQAVSIPGFPNVPIKAVPLLPAITRDALVIKGRNAIIVAFAGTDPPRIQDWLVNFAALPTAATGVSSGLADVAAVFAPLLKPLVTQDNNLTLFVTGHSLGASLGVAVAHELSRTNCKVEAVYTYGMPRAGNAAFAADYDGRLGKRTFRFVHGDDLVPTVPPANLAGVQHQHVGWFIHCARGAKFALNQKSTDTKSNEPLRDDDILSGLFSQASFGARVTAAWNALASGRPIDSIKELSPERIRQHLQDQYIAALTP